MPSPDVTVIIPAYNSMPYVTKTVQSVFDQSLGMDRIEIIAVDDGSTDGTGEELDRLAAGRPNMTVLHEPNSGGPARPRNVGLERAAGRYVFFLDADDYFNTEALERMVRCADEQGSDIVMGKMGGSGGRRPPKSMYTSTQLSTTVFESRAWWTLNPLKLFRHELIERLNLRFPEDLTYEDQPFTGTAYLNARVISILADYDYVYWVWRDDGANITRLDIPLDRLTAALDVMIRLIVDNVEPGPGRSLLLTRHFEMEFFELLGYMADSSDSGAVEQAFSMLRGWAIAHYPYEVIWDLSPAHRVAHNLLVRGEREALLGFMRHIASYPPWDVVIEGDRAFAAYPLFRDESAGVPDECFDVTWRLKPRYRLNDVSWRDGRLHIEGSAYIDLLDTSQTETELVVRERETEVEWALPVKRFSSPDFESETWRTRFTHGFAAIAVDLDPLTAASGRPLGDGLWDLFLRLTASGFVRTVRIGRLRDPKIKPGLHWQVLPADSAEGYLVGSYFTAGFDNLSLDIGAVRRAFPERVPITSVAWSPSEKDVIVASGRSRIAGLGPATMLTGCLDSKGISHPATAEFDAENFAIRVPLRSEAGRLARSGDTLTLSIQVPLRERRFELIPSTTHRCEPLHFWRWGLPYRATISAPGQPFAVTVARVRIARAVMRRLRETAKRIQTVAGMRRA